MTELEICINCDGQQAVRESVAAAIAGGAARIELCRAMHEDGLTPLARHITEAREALGDCRGLMVMIRPKPGNFNFSENEILLMEDQIKVAADLGADGAVLGVLNETLQQIDVKSLEQLVNLTHKLKLQTTFHRAFDATLDFIKSAEVLIEAGIDRVLTSGTKWQDKQPAIKGIKKLRELIEKVDNRLEIVIGGGISSKNVVLILDRKGIINEKILLWLFDIDLCDVHSVDLPYLWCCTFCSTVERNRNRHRR